MVSNVEKETSYFSHVWNSLEYLGCWIVSPYLWLYMSLSISCFVRESPVMFRLSFLKSVLMGLLLFNIHLNWFNIEIFIISSSFIYVQCIWKLGVGYFLGVLYSPVFIVVTISGYLRQADYITAEHYTENQVFNIWDLEGNTRSILLQLFLYIFGIKNSPRLMKVRKSRRYVKVSLGVPCPCLC